MYLSLFYKIVIITYFIFYLIAKTETEFIIMCVQGEMNESITTTQGHIGITETDNVISKSVI